MNNRNLIMLFFSNARQRSTNKSCNQFRMSTLNMLRIISIVQFQVCNTVSDDMKMHFFLWAIVKKFENYCPNVSNLESGFMQGIFGEMLIFCIYIIIMSYSKSYTNIYILKYLGFKYVSCLRTLKYFDIHVFITQINEFSSQRSSQLYV